MWFPRDYDAEFDAIFSRAAVPVDDPAIYVCAPDDPLMRPDPDSEAWFVLVNAPRHEATSTAGRRSPGTIDWDAPGLRDSYADHVLARLAERGMDIRDRVLWRELRSPSDLDRRQRDVVRSGVIRAGPPPRRRSTSRPSPDP